MAPSPEIVRIAAEIGLRYPPRNSVDEADHAARVALLADDCNDVDATWLDAAASEWARTKPFFPRACELRELAGALERLSTPAPKMIAPPPPPPAPAPPPLSDDEIARMPGFIVKMGIEMGEIDPAKAAALRGETP